MPVVSVWIPSRNGLLAGTAVAAVAAIGVYVYNSKSRLSTDQDGALEGTSFTTRDRLFGRKKGTSSSALTGDLGEVGTVETEGQDEASNESQGSILGWLLWKVPGEWLAMFTRQMFGWRRGGTTIEGWNDAFRREFISGMGGSGGRKTDSSRYMQHGRSVRGGQTHSVLISSEEEDGSGMSSEEFREHGYRMIDFIVEYRTNMLQQIKPSASSTSLLQVLPREAPAYGEDFEEIMCDVERLIIPGLNHWMHPHFFGYYPQGGSYASILGELCTAGLNCMGFMWQTGPAVTELEMVCIGWLGKMIGLPPKFTFSSGGGGVIESGAGEAVLCCLVAAKERRLRGIEDDNMRREMTGRMVVYTSDQAHLVVQKSCRIIGIEEDRLRIIKTFRNDHFAMRGDALREKICEDRNEGLIPLFVCCCLGTTSSCAIDDIAEIGTVCREMDLWLHVDGAYGGAFPICPENRVHMNGIENVDSFSMNCHKQMLVNFECAPLWVADRNALTDSLRVTSEYLKASGTSVGGEIVDYKDWQVGFGRKFRSLKLYFVLRNFGVSGICESIRHCTRLAKYLEDKIKKDPHFEVYVPRYFGLVCFRLNKTALSRAGVKFSDRRDLLNHFNGKLKEALTKNGDVLLLHTVLDGVYVLRMAIGGYNSTEEDIDDCWRSIQSCAAHVLKNTTV
eukprot:Nk52_evm3s2367 gene=Nk52_evmTU3s2367